MGHCRAGQGEPSGRRHRRGAKKPCGLGAAGCRSVGRGGPSRRRHPEGTFRKEASMRGGSQEGGGASEGGITGRKGDVAWKRKIFFLA